MPIIRSNVISAIEVSQQSVLLRHPLVIKILLDVAAEKFNYSLAAESKESEKRVRAVLLETDDHGSAQYTTLLQDIITLYQDPNIQKCLEQKTKFYVGSITLILFSHSLRDGSGYQNG